MALKKTYLSKKFFPKWKDTVLDIEDNIDEQIFYDFEVSYDTLIKALSNISVEKGITAHNLLMDYLTFIKDVRRDEQREEIKESKRGIRN